VGWCQTLITNTKTGQILFLEGAIQSMTSKGKLDTYTLKNGDQIYQVVVNRLTLEIVQ